MIRRFETRDLDEVMSLWLHANIESHSFIETDYWKKNYDMVRKLIPEAEVFVAEENEEIQGFIGLTDTYIAGIFVKATEQSKGIGTELLRTVMKLKDHLKLNVYKKNMRAVDKWQHGTAVPTIDNLVVLAALLQVKIDDILVVDAAFRVQISA